MKGIYSFWLPAVAAMLCITAPSCIKMEDLNQKNESEKTAKIILTLDKHSLSGATKLPEEEPLREEIDTTLYLLKIVNSSGAVVYEGRYIARPREFSLAPATYNISVASRKFTEPEKDHPLFGDNVSVKCKGDSTLRIALKSAQLTGGVRFEFSDNFKKHFSGEGIFLRKEAVETFVEYSFGRYLFYYPGNISVVYKGKGADTLLLTKKIKADELLTLRLDYDKTDFLKSGFSITIDTVRRRLSEYYNVAGGIPYGCISVAQAKEAILDTVTVFGYIIGGDASSSSDKFSYKAPFSSSTHIIIADGPGEVSRKEGMAIGLPSGSRAREELNLQDHPELLGHSVKITGVVVEKYFGYPGIKTLKAYELY